MKTTNAIIVATTAAAAELASARSMLRRQWADWPSIAFVNNVRNVPTGYDTFTLALQSPDTTGSFFLPDVWDDNYQAALLPNSTVTFDMYQYCNTDVSFVINSVQDATNQTTVLTNEYGIASNSPVGCFTLTNTFEPSQNRPTPAIVWSVEEQTLGNTGPTVYICSADDFVTYLNSCNFNYTCQQGIC
eukprot:Clim_evm260s157 gene=Clim_evmTU260s157